ncbi:glycosyltransferase family 2 protein [Mixia osmundae IAM 14324]|uniref:chitin synthase n=1 Tax=Mixia osmundae (strain CBS 9802 / IAM 14324 / JCM 22182 / KY 12970) TaxID=764103 RepID=G7DV55_MIXOS|nr:glycosyltransferase family 2 protein [Mixia osmundae IAM 14324]KEI36318.1 glycosyltransferase family 2 protein [Mixia osmundae IAM 14324]GAA94465.1 hypothetical protein E5Q_01117 [Mixia osmundae IAM 14324]
MPSPRPPKAVQSPLRSAGAEAYHRLPTPQSSEAISPGSHTSDRDNTRDPFESRYAPQGDLSTAALELGPVAFPENLHTSLTSLGSSETLVQSQSGGSIGAMLHDIEHDHTHRRLVDHRDDDEEDSLAQLPAALRAHQDEDEDEESQYLTQSSFPPGQGYSHMRHGSDSPSSSFDQLAYPPKTTERYAGVSLKDEPLSALGASASNDAFRLSLLSLPPGAGPTKQQILEQREWQKRAGAPKRGLTRRLKLVGGNFIADYEVPRAVLNAVESQYLDGSRKNEFSHMRYTAATCDPDDFTPQNGWTLRAREAGRDTELLIAITSYNEDRALLSRTLHGVMLNVRDIVRSNARFWRRTAEEGRPGWQRIVICLIFDGLDPADKGALDILQTIGAFQDNIMKKDIDGKETVAHIFEYTTQLSVCSTASGKFSLVTPAQNTEGQGSEANLVPAQMIVCIKQKNAKKINSHRWLFNGFGRQLAPEVCILIDAGTKPGTKSLYYLWEAFYNDRHLGGACGEIHAMLQGGKKLINPLVAAQNLEYKMSNILDKPLESSFGYVSVLPGAFSAYRYCALQGRPLEQYFHGDHSLADRLGKKGLHGMGIFKKNMFLAEDRILCFELVAKAGASWKLKYVKPSKGETDVPESAAELISQRRRWLNGSFAASIYAMVHFFRLYQTRHNPLRMLFFHIQALFNIFSTIFSFFALANMWLTFSLIIQLLPALDAQHPVYLFGTRGITLWVNEACLWIWAGTLALSFIIALGNRPKGEAGTYVLMFWIFALLGYYLLVCAVWLTIKAFTGIQWNGASTIGEKVGELLTGSNNVLVAALVSTYGVYLFSSLLYGDPWHMLHSFPQYLALAPSFVNILNVYAFCNLHDVSWGTKGSDKADALPSVSSKKEKGSDGVVEDIQKLPEDIELAFKETVSRTLAPYKPVEEPKGLSIDDSNRTFRTRFVSVWLLANGGLVFAVMNVAGVDTHTIDSQKNMHSRQGFYFNIILWATFGFAFIKFMGCLAYFLSHNLGKCCRRN